MMQIEGTITTLHGNAGCVAAALAPDNLRSMETKAEEGQGHNNDHRDTAPVGHRISGRLSDEPGSCGERMFRPQKRENNITR